MNNKRRITLLMMLVLCVSSMANVGDAGRLDTESYDDYSESHNSDKDYNYLKQVLPALLKSNGIKSDECQISKLYDIPNSSNDSRISFIKIDDTTGICWATTYNNCTHVYYY